MSLRSLNEAVLTAFNGKKKRVTSKGPGIKGAPGSKNPSPRHRPKKKVRTQTRYGYRPDPKGRVTSRGPGIKGAPGSKVARYEKKTSKNYRKASSAYAKGK